MDPLVTVLIPTRNHADSIGQAIKSVLAQTYRNFEIIIVDDESADNTKEVIEKYPVQYYFIRHKGQSTPARALNFGIEKAMGKFIVCLGADDALRPEFIKKCYERYIEAKDKGLDVGMVWTGYETFGPFPPQIQIPAMDETHSQYDFLMNPCGAIGATFVPKNVYYDVGLYNEDIIALEDWDIAIRILLHDYTAVSVREPLYLYFIGKMFVPEYLVKIHQILRKKHEQAVLECIGKEREQVMRDFYGNS